MAEMATTPRTVTGSSLGVFTVSECVSFCVFSTLSKENINLQMISTSEIKISVVVEDKYMELAVRALHQAFELDKATA